MNILLIKQKDFTAHSNDFTALCKNTQKKSHWISYHNKKTFWKDLKFIC